MLNDLLLLEGNLPRDIKEEAYILYDLGLEIEEIEYMIHLRTRRRKN